MKREDSGPKEPQDVPHDDEDDFYDDEFEDWFDESSPRPLSVDEYFELPLYDPRRWAPFNNVEEPAGEDDGT